MPTGSPIKYAQLGHIHIIVDDLDEAADFYREVLDFIEMQSHDRLVNKGAATYYGLGDEYQDLEISLRFMFLPELLTIKLVKIDYKGESSDYSVSSRYGKPSSIPNALRNYSRKGVGPINLYVDDLDATYEALVHYVRDYGSRFRFQLLSPPTFLSPILPHQIGARPVSALHGQHELLEDLARTFPKRAKFQLVDPFGVTWEFNNNVL